MVMSFEEAMQRMYDAQHRHIRKLRARRRWQAINGATGGRKRHEEYLRLKARAQTPAQPSSISTRP